MGKGGCKVEEDDDVLRDASPEAVDLCIPTRLTREEALEYIRGIVGQGFLVPSRRNDQGLDIDSIQLWLHGYSLKTFDTFETNKAWQQRVLWDYERKACYRFGVACADISRQYLAQAKLKAVADAGGVEDITELNTTKLLVGLLGWWNLVKYLPMKVITFHEEGQDDGKSKEDAAPALNQQSLSVGLCDVELDLKVPSWIGFLARDCRPWDYVHIIAEYIGIPDSYQGEDQGLAAWLCGYSNIRSDKDLIRYNTQDWVGGYLARFHPDLSELAIQKLEGAEKRAAAKRQLEERSAIRKELLASGEYSGPEFAKMLSTRAFYIIGAIKDGCFREGMKQGKINLAFECFFRFIVPATDLEAEPKSIKKVMQQFRLDYHPDKFFRREEAAVREKMGRLQGVVDNLRDHNYKVGELLFDGCEVKDLPGCDLGDSETRPGVESCVKNVFSLVETVWQRFAAVVGDKNVAAKLEEYVESTSVAT